MSVCLDRPQQVLFLSEYGYIEQTLCNFGIWNAKPVITSIYTNKLKFFEERYTNNALEKQWYT